MKKLYALLMKLFGTKCDRCGKVFTTERGKNIHRAVHIKRQNKLKKMIEEQDRFESQRYSHNPLEGQDVDLWLRKNK